MAKICNHLFHPFTHGKIRLSNNEKRFSKILGIAFIPFLLIPGFCVFYGITYYFKNKAIRNYKTPNKIQKKTVKVFSSFDKNSHLRHSTSVATSKGHLSANLQNTKSNIPLGYTLCLDDITFKTQQKAVEGILTAGNYDITSFGEIITPNFELRKTMRHAGIQFVDSFHPAVLKKNRNINPHRYQILQMNRLGLVFALKEKIVLSNGNSISEGSVPHLTVSMITANFASFYKNKSKQFNWLTPERYQWIEDNLKGMLFGNMVDNNEIKIIADILQQPDFKASIASSSGFNEHCFVTGFIGSIAYILNRGIYSKHGVTLYALKAENRPFITEQVVTDIVRAGKLDRDSFFGHDAMVGEIGATVIANIKLTRQDSGNCTYKSIEAFLCALFAFQYLHSIDEVQFYKNLENKDLLQAAFESINPAFEDWVNYDRRLLYDDLMVDWTAMQKRSVSDPERIMYQVTLDNVHDSLAYGEMISYEEKINES